MATQEPKPLSTPPPTVSTSSSVNPTRMNLGESQQPADAQKKRYFIIGAGILIFLILAGAIPLFILSISKTSPAKTPTPAPASPTPKPSTDPAATQDMTSRIFLKNGTGRLTYDLTLAPPIGWNASYSTSPASPAYPWTGSLLITALKSGYSPLSTANVNIPSTNFLAFMDATDWLGTNQSSPSFSAAQKQTWFASVSSLTQDGIGSASSIANPVNTSDSGRISLSYVQAQSAALRGFAYITQPTSGRYEPAMVAILAGKLDGKSVILYGRHTIRDKQWSTLANLQSSGDGSYAAQRDAAIASFAAGTLREDTVAIYKEFTKTIDSFTLKSVNN